MDKSTIISSDFDDSQSEEQPTTSGLSQRPDQSQALAATANVIDADINAQHPWPHLKKYFTLKAVNKDKTQLQFACVLCKPKETVIKAHASSLFNLKSHIKKIHSTRAKQFEETIKAGSSRGKHLNKTSSQTDEPPPKKTQVQLTISETLINRRGPFCPNEGSQKQVDTKIVDFFVCNMIAFNVVESSSFFELVKTLNPKRNVISRRTLGRRVSRRYDELQSYLVRILEQVPWVSTTADCWTAHHKSYLGMTVHWLDLKTRSRKHAVLACCRIKGHHTYDVLAETISSVHCKFNLLQDKVTRTTTDNAKNFAKAFIQFSKAADVLPDVVEPNVDEDLIVDAEEDANDDENPLEYISIESVVEDSFENITADDTYELPVHTRCAAHTFNLVATVDADNALDNGLFKSMYRKAMAKAQALWNHQSRSTVAADLILNEMKRRLVVPCSTRWNSTYDSVVVLNDLLQKNRGAVHKVMSLLKLHPFSESEIKLLKEYALVMSSLAKALDKIQGENQAYFGTLLPIVTATVIKLKEVKSKGLAYCSPLVDALLAGIKKRFGKLLDDEDCLLAAAFHPKFRLFWIEKEDLGLFLKVKQAMISAVEKGVRNQLRQEQTIDENATSSENEEDDFFGAITQHAEAVANLQTATHKAKDIVKKWLGAYSQDSFDDAVFLNEKVLIDLFIKYNTAIPSSAAVERLFCSAKDILRAKRSTLSDQNFEKLLFMKGNQLLLSDREAEKQ